MKKIFESEFNGWNESATRLIVYEIESEDEYWELDEMEADEIRRALGLPYDGDWIMPGAFYQRTYIHKLDNHIIAEVYGAYNV